MPTTTNCEMVIRSLAHDWRGEPEQFLVPAAMIEFVDFADWVRARGYGQYLDHLTRIGRDDAPRRWFAEELHLTAFAAAPDSATSFGRVHG